MNNFSKRADKKVVFARFYSESSALQSGSVRKKKWFFSLMRGASSRLRSNIYDRLGGKESFKPSRTRKSISRREKRPTSSSKSVITVFLLNPIRYDTGFRICCRAREDAQNGFRTKLIRYLGDENGMLQVV